jgi:hypothetical protein
MNYAAQPWTCLYQRMISKAAEKHDALDVLKAHDFSRVDNTNQFVAALPAEGGLSWISIFSGTLTAAC